MKNGISFALIFNFQIVHPNFQFFAVMHTRKPHDKAWCKLFRFVSFQHCNIYRTLTVKSVMVILVRLIWKLLFVKRFFFFLFFPWNWKLSKKFYDKFIIRFFETRVYSLLLCKGHSQSDRGKCADILKEIRSLESSKW